MFNKKAGKEVRVIIAGGGTGGHLFPGIAIAGELRKKFGEIDILFVVGRKKMEKEIIHRAGFETRSIVVEGMLGKGVIGGIRALFKVLISSIQSLILLGAFKPRVVVGVGGYSSGPVCLIARFLGIPTVIHEQNSFPGFTNRILARLVDKVFISFEESRKYFKKGTLLLTGNPVRDELLRPSLAPENGQERFIIFVVGGSQGAQSINRAIVSALKDLKEDDLFPLVIHQAGEKDCEKVRDDYRALGLDGDVRPFIEDMASAYARADLVICRAGATTIAELAVLGKPSVLIPYPYAAHHHQEMNARALVDVGGADMILERDLDGDSLAGKIRRYMQNRAELKRMSSLVLEAAQPRAKEVIVEELTKLLGKPESP